MSRIVILTLLWVIKKPQNVQRLEIYYSTGKDIIVTLHNIRYVPSFIGNLISISTAMSNGPEIQFRNKKMEVQKRDAVFEFLLTNSDNCGFYLVLMVKEELINVKRPWWHKNKICIMRIMLKRTRRLHLMKNC